MKFHNECVVILAIQKRIEMHWVYYMQKQKLECACEILRLVFYSFNGVENLAYHGNDKEEMQNMRLEGQ